LYGLAVFFAPERGLVFKFYRKRTRERRIEIEDVIKQGARLEQNGAMTIDGLVEKTVLPKGVVTSRLKTLAKRGLVTLQPLAMTNLGKLEAFKLVRAHRLYETFLVDRLGLSEDQIHDEAERYEHLLTDELLDEIDQELGYPETDPHGSPIPKRG
jgi:Mn-dependent DtxR family transcriptional regulator